MAAMALGTIALPAFAATTVPFAPFSQDPFTDVSENHDSFRAIEFLRGQNVLRGYPDGTFKPDNRINRAEFVYLITNPFLLDITNLSDCIRKEELSESPTIYFSDVDREAWYAPSVCHAKDSKLIDGYPDGTFKPGDSINFVEAAKILSNTFALQTIEEDGDRWFDPYVRELSDLRVIPTSIETFGQTVTRGEMAEMLYRLKEDVSNRPYRGMDSLRF